MAPAHNNSGDTEEIENSGWEGTHTSSQKLLWSVSGTILCGAMSLGLAGSLAYSAVLIPPVTGPEWTNVIGSAVIGGCGFGLPTIAFATYIPRDWRAVRAEVAERKAAQKSGRPEIIRHDENPAIKNEP